MKNILPSLLLATTLFSCGHYSSDQEEIVSMQVFDRNGFSETVTSKERLNSYVETNFLDPQPFQKVLRTYSKKGDVKNHSVVTTYHDNGYIYQYLEIKDGRANGVFREWHQNGNLRLEVNVIEGIPDITEMALASWVFDQKSSVYDEEGNTVALIHYDKGMLCDKSFYYYPNGMVKKEIPYVNNQISGEVTHYDDAGNVSEQESYLNGKKHGKSLKKWDVKRIQSEETYEADKLMGASYYDMNGRLLSEIVRGSGKKTSFAYGKVASTSEYRNGQPEGEVKFFDENQRLTSSFNVKNDLKHGDEREYYSSINPGDELKEKLFIYWREDSPKEVKTWYPNGQQESQSQMHENQKNGVCLGWYKDGNIMFVEEYRKGKLTSGKYYHRGEKTPCSTVQNEEGKATLFDAEGHYLQTVVYEKGAPVSS